MSIILVAASTRSWNLASRVWDARQRMMGEIGDASDPNCLEGIDVRHQNVGYRSFMGEHTYFPCGGG